MSEKFDRLVNIVKRLRSPNGCPWDRKQTLYSLKQNVIEEVFEFIDALDRKDTENIKEELGDMLLHVVFHSIIAEEEKLFTLNDVLETISEKLIRRHPHVFGNTKVKDVEEVLKNWDKIKSKEKNSKKDSILGSVPRSLPPIERALKLQKEASKVGFDWKSPEDCFEKVKEEFQELESAQKTGEISKIKHEIGDTMFALINYARLKGIDPSEALREASLRFENRFSCVERKLKEKNKTPSSSTLEEMESLWELCKKELEPD